MSDSAGITFRRHDGAAARELRDVVEQVYAGSYTEAIAEAAATGHPFHSPPRSWTGTATTPPSRGLTS